MAAAPPAAAQTQGRAALLRLRATRARAAGDAQRLRWTSASILQAVKLYAEAARQWQQAGDTVEAGQTFVAIADAYTSIGRHEEALASYESALAQFRAGGDRAGEVSARNGVGSVYVFLGRIPEAESYCRETLALSREAGGEAARAQALHNLGDVFYNQSRMEAALEQLTTARALWEQAGDRRGEARTLTLIGYTHVGLNRVTEAVEDYNRALPLWRAAGDRRGLALTLTALANLYNKLEEKQKALDLYDEAIALVRPLGDPYGEASALAGMAYAYERSGDQGAALDCYNRALQLYRQTRHRLGETITLLVTGRIYNSLGDQTRAMQNLRLALSASEALSDPLVTSYVLGHLGKVYDSLGEKSRALDHYGRALELNRVGHDRREEAYTLNNIGSVRLSLGEAEKASALFREALALNRAARDPGGEALTRFNLARAERSLGRDEAAHAQIKEALDISESLRTKVAGQELRASYFATVHQQFELYVDTLMRLHRQQPGKNFDAAAFEASERGRARSLLEALAEGREDIREGVSAALLERERELQRQLSAKAERRIQLAGEESSAEELAAFERDVEGLTTEYERVRGQIRASSPRYAALVQPVPLTLGEVQARVLDADTVLLEYALGEERSFVWAVTPDSIKGFELPARAEVERAARRVYELLTAPNRAARGETWAQRSARLARAEADYAEASDALGRMLLGPVAGLLAGKRVAVVADGALQYVPFAALPDPSGSGPLVLGHEVVSLPSASVPALLREELRGRSPAPKAVAVLADPVFDAADERLASAKAGGGAGRRAGTGAGRATLSALRDFEGLTDGGGVARLPFSRREAEAIMASVPQGEGMLALGFRASRVTATAPELSQYRVVHFATHSLLNSEHPELSGVVLSLYDETGRPQDGFLQLHEVYNLRLRADLVVLSACQTALGKDVRGEGLVGLTRGFMYAGAPRVVASLWQVDDAATAELMGEFYRSMLGEGQRPAAALRSAQTKMLGRARWRSPYYWAAFTLQGEWR